MFEGRTRPTWSTNRFSLLAVGISLLATLFHLLVTRPNAQADADTPTGWARLHRVLNHPERQTAGLPKGNHPRGGVPVAASAPVRPTAPAPAAHPQGEPAQADHIRQGAQTPTVADPALLHVLQQALRERRDAEYIYRLRHFRRQPPPIHCPPLPSYSLKGIELSYEERAAVSCHEQRQLQAQCVWPADLFSPMRCPKGYQWRLEDDQIETERRWLAARTSKTLSRQ